MVFYEYGVPRNRRSLVDRMLFSNNNNNSAISSPLGRRRKIWLSLLRGGPGSREALFQKAKSVLISNSLLLDEEEGLTLWEGGDSKTGSSDGVEPMVNVCLAELRGLRNGGFVFENYWNNDIFYSVKKGELGEEGRELVESLLVMWKCFGGKRFQPGSFVSVPAFVRYACVRMSCM